MKITIRTDRGPIDVEWERTAKELKFYAFYQNGRFMDYQSPNDMTDEQFRTVYEARVQERFDKLMRMLPGLSDTARIVNVGSGTGTLDIVLARYLGLSTHFLIDKESMTTKQGPYYGSDGNEHGFYNSWNPLEEASGSVADRILVYDVNDKWPVDVDLVYSSYSWCWHYPYAVYRGEMLRTLKQRGALILDVLKPPGSEEWRTITTDMMYLPKFERYEMHPKSRVHEQFDIKDSSHGACYLWIRSKEST